MPDVSQLQTRIASALGITYSEAGVLAKRLQPVIVVDDIQQIGESADTATRYAMHTGTALGAGAILGQVGLVNPVGSGMRVILESIWLSSNATGQISGAQEGVSLLGTEVVGVYRDSGPGQPVGIVTSGDRAAFPAPTVDLLLPNDDVHQPPLQSSLDPGFQFTLFARVTARSIMVTFFWKEIRLPRLV